MNDEKRNASGEVISFRTKRLGVRVFRQAYHYRDTVSYTKGFNFIKIINGRSMCFPLSRNPKEAANTAEQIAAYLMDRSHTLDEAKRKFDPRASLRPNGYSTVGELFEFHTAHWKILSLTETTGKSYQAGLMLMMRYVKGYRTGSPVENWSGRRTGMEERVKPWLGSLCEALDSQLAIDYKRLMTDTLEDEDDIQTAEITCDTTFSGAKKLFSDAAMDLYKRSSTLVLPMKAIEDFKSVKLFGTKKYFELPPTSVIREVFRLSLELRIKDLNAYRVFLLCIQCGLRKGEAANLRMDWIREEDTPVICIPSADGSFKPKHGHGRKVLIEPWVASALRELAGERKYFLEGNDGERTEQVFIRLNEWLRARGVEATKPTHELRKYWFSYMVKEHGLLAAAQQGGHKDPKVTQTSYAASAMPDNVHPFWEQPTMAALAALKIA